MNFFTRKQIGLCLCLVHETSVFCDQTVATDYHSYETPVIQLEDLIGINIYFKSLSTDWDDKL